jgi:hypothetical protein
MKVCSASTKMSAGASAAGGYINCMQQQKALSRMRLNEQLPPQVEQKEGVLS